MRDHNQLTNGTCIVRGCKEAPILCANNKLHGLVSVCACHSPMRFGLDLPLPTMQKIVLTPILDAAEPPSPPGKGSSGGSKVPQPAPKPSGPPPMAAQPLRPVVANPF